SGACRSGGLGRLNSFLFIFDVTSELSDKPFPCVRRPVVQSGTGARPGHALQEVRVNFTLTKKSLTIRIFFLCLLACLNAAGARAQTQTPSPALVVLDKEDNMLSIIDPATSKTIARIPTGDGPHEITASDDGKLAFVANYGARTPGNTISVIDLVAQK